MNWYFKSAMAFLFSFFLYETSIVNGQKYYTLIYDKDDKATIH